MSFVSTRAFMAAEPSDPILSIGGESALVEGVARARPTSRISWGSWERVAQSPLPAVGGAAVGFALQPQFELPREFLVGPARCILHRLDHGKQR